ncbi:MAG: TolC family protein [Acidobacteria bacterium]|nr:TolC family protein [Acidobacteriota bacterium]
MKNAWRRIVAGALLCVLLSTSVWGQGAIQSAATGDRETRVGVDRSKRVRLTLRDAITLALENNRDIEVERLNVQLNEFDLRGSYGAYDPTLSTGIYYDRSRIPIANIIAGGPDGGLQTDNIVGNAQLQQRAPWHGGSFTGQFSNDRATTTNLFNALNPQYSTSLSFTYTQPLWRNREIDAPRRQIRIAKKRLDISDSQFRQRAVEIIAQVQRAYWDLVFARRDREIKVESVELAQTQLESNQRRVEAGVLAPSDVISARVEVERRTDEAEAALEAIQRAENALKGLLLQPENSEIWQSELEPTEVPEIDSSVRTPLQDAVRLAFRNRPELEQFRLRGELNKVDIDFFRDQTKPQIDLFASYRTAGLSGNIRPEENPFTAGNIALYSRINQLSQLAGLPPLDFGNGGGIPDAFLGSYGQSLVNLLRNDFRTWRFGLNITLPIRNRTAQAQLGRALAEGRQLDAQRQRTETQIEIEVRNALQAAETARRRVEAAKNSRANAELQYQSEVRKFEAGQSTNFLVLDRQNALSSARGRELRALTDYTKAAAELQRALSTTLVSNSVELKSANQHR